MVRVKRRFVTQQALAAGAVSGRDAHQGIEGEAAAVLPLRHRLRVIVQRQAATRVPAQQPPVGRG
jgi:hypothetical protein